MGKPQERSKIKGIFNIDFKDVSRLFLENF